MHTQSRPKARLPEPEGRALAPPKLDRRNYPAAAVIFSLGIHMEIKPNQIWRKNREPARVINVSGDQIEMHFFERGPPTVPNIARVRAAELRVQYEFLRDE
jgi:hypothetical protein